MDGKREKRTAAISVVLGLLTRLRLLYVSKCFHKAQHIRRRRLTVTENGAK